MKSNLENTRERLDELGMCNAAHFLQNDDRKMLRGGGGRSNTPCDPMPGIPSQTGDKNARIDGLKTEFTHAFHFV